MRLRVVMVWLTFFSACGGIDDLTDDGGTLVTGTGGGGSTTTSCTDTWSSYGATFFSSACSSCHQHSSEFTTRASVVSRLSSIKSEISSGKMPEGTSLSATDKARILAYLTCGAP